MLTRRHEGNRASLGSALRFCTPGLLRRTGPDVRGCGEGRLGWPRKEWRER